MIGSGAGQLLEQVFGNIQGGAVGHGLPPPMPAGGMGGAGAMLQNLLSSMGNRHVSRHRSSHHHLRTEDAADNELQVVNETIANPGWIPNSTLERWTECFTIFNPGMQPTERIQLYAKRITAVLTPEKQRRQREQDEKDAKEKAERMKVMEEQAAKEEEEEAQREREREEAAAAEAVTIDSAEAPPVTSENPAEVADSTMDLDTAPLAAPETPSQQVHGSSAAQAGGSSDRPNWRERVARRRHEQATAAASQQAASAAADADELARVLALANSFASGLPAAVAETSSQPIEGTTPASVAMASEPAEAEPEAQEEEAPEAGPSAAAAPSERVTIQIRGNTVDITDTGIDPTFLEALPDDMREE
jgi:E3 ubiquitin-protein ligase HUWE1